MSEDNKSLVRRFFDAFNEGRLDEAVDELVADDFVEHEEPPPGFPEADSDKESVRIFFRVFSEAFEGLRMDVEDLVAEGDQVAVRSRMRGTHRGEFMGIPPTGRSVDVEVIDWVRIRDGQAVEHWGVTDAAALMEQLGAVEGAPA